MIFAVCLSKSVHVCFRNLLFLPVYVCFPTWGNNMQDQRVPLLLRAIKADSSGLPGFRRVGGNYETYVIYVI